MLNRNAPAHIKENAYRNILFYIQKLPNTTYLPITVKDQQSAQIVSTSILKWGEVYQLCVQTTASPLIDMNTENPDSKKFLIDYDKDLKLVSQQEIFNNDETPLVYDPIICGRPPGYSKEPTFEFSALKSSCPPIPWGKEFLMIVYEVVSVDQKKYHVHRLMTLDKNYMIEKLSKPFIFQNFGIERCGNAVIDHAEKKLIVPITFENGSAYLANIELNSLQSILELIEASSGRYQAIVPNPEEFFKLKTELIHIIETEKDETNPFAIPFKPKDNLTDDDYKEIQKELKELKVTEYLKTIYQDPAIEFSKYTTLEDSENRCTKGSKQVLL